VNEPAPPAHSSRRRSARIAARVSGEQRRLIAAKAAFEGRSLSAFIVATVGDAARRVVEARGCPSTGGFEVLCRIDAYADYVAEVEAEDAEEAAQLASDNPADYKWVHHQTQEFDARLYVTLDSDGNEIEETQVGDF
jgi:hypothetical protein